jgi:hypothetical protein
MSQIEGEPSSNRIVPLVCDVRTKLGVAGKLLESGRGAPVARQPVDPPAPHNDDGEFSVTVPPTDEW